MSFRNGLASGGKHDMPGRTALLAKQHLITSSDVILMPGDVNSVGDFRTLLLKGNE